MNKYEVLYVIDPAMEDEPRKELIERFSGIITGNGGTVDKIDEWGKRRLAYPINDLNEGYYVLMSFDSDAAFPNELARVLRITDGVMRSQVVCLDE